MLSRLTVNEWKLLEKMASLLVQERIDNKVFIAKFEEGSTEPTPTPEQPTPTPEQPTPTPEQPTPTPEQPTPTPEQPTPTPEQPTPKIGRAHV